VSRLYPFEARSSSYYCLKIKFVTQIKQKRVSVTKTNLFILLGKILLFNLSKNNKAVPLHTTKALGGERYSSYSFSTSALDGGEWPESRTGRALVPGNGPPVPIVQEARWAPEPIWTQRLEEKSFCLCRESKLDRPVVEERIIETHKYTPSEKGKLHDC
jgi:hypothetical protein